MFENFLVMIAKKKKNSNTYPNKLNFWGVGS